MMEALAASLTMTIRCSAMLKTSADTISPGYER